MKLSQFLKTLYAEGKVTVAGAMTSFEPEDLPEATIVMQQFYTEDILEMPGTAPAFEPEAALWAAQYFYKALQLTVLRDLDENTVTAQLAPYEAPINPEAIYSADLVLRYLPGLFDLAKGLSPQDIVVEKLKEIAVQWNFSAVGIDLDAEPDLSILFEHPSLKYAYLDRVIRANDKNRAQHPAVAELMAEVLGAFPELIKTH